MNGEDLLNCLLSVAQKAGRIAKACREDSHLLSLLVQEKKESEKNPRFVHDFKTLADVLVQEVIKHDLCTKFSALEGHVYGEESNEFSNGEVTLKVEVKHTEEETSALLNQVLNDTDAASILAGVIHGTEGHLDISTETVDLSELPTELGLWIDPIDSTSEYIQGNSGDDEGLVRSGLPCVTVLIGVFDRSTGSPVIGVVNQPFAANNSDGSWRSNYFFGVNHPCNRVTYPHHTLCTNEKLVAVSSSESNDTREMLNKNGYTPTELAGAGYKLLKIVTGEVYAYVLSKPTTFLWDTCACQAILESFGGGIMDYTTAEPLKYKSGHGVKECCNEGGIIAYRNEEVKEDLLRILNLVK